MNSTLKKKLIRLAYTRPDLRAEILPLIAHERRVATRTGGLGKILQRQIPIFISQLQDILDRYVKKTAGSKSTALVRRGVKNLEIHVFLKGSGMPLGKAEAENLAGKIFGSEFLLEATNVGGPAGAGWMATRTVRDLL